jgi:hypothetical protein
MVAIIRRSPVVFDVSPSREEKRDHWTVALEYPGEGEGPWITDLCHKTRWDVQDGDLLSLASETLPIPEAYGRVALSQEMSVNRMNRTQAAVWHFTENPGPMPNVAAFTETTEATVFLALYGPQVFAVTEKLTSLDLGGPDTEPPQLVQGPFSHVPCQIVVAAKGDTPGILLTCSRGYARDMVHAILDAGQEFGMRPAGEERFKQWCNQF